MFSKDMIIIKVVSMKIYGALPIILILGHFEHPPYNEDTMRSAYHTRSIDAFRMKQIKLPIDIILSHDWPQGIYNFGDVDTLVRKKQHFKEQVEPGARNPLGR